MGWPVAGEIDRAQVRLAELVAALSLAIDLGFGQPMEHAVSELAAEAGARFGPAALRGISPVLRAG
jgi:hypothetical protein